MGINIDSAVIREFECSECFQYMQPPIRICPNSHCYCDTCFNEVQTCPICNCNGFIRNRPLERIFEKLRFPCKHSECHFEGDGLVIKQHEEECKYVPIRCPFVRYGCRWKGSFGSLEDHVGVSHKLIEELSATCTLYDYDGEGSWREVIKIQGELFLVCFVKNSSEFKLGVYMLKSTDMDDSFEYQVTFRDNWGKRSVGVSGPCVYFKNYHEEDIDNQNSDSFPIEIIDSFYSDEKVIYNLTIVKRIRNSH